MNPHPSPAPNFTIKSTSMKKEGLVCCYNTHCMCAERRLLTKSVEEAKRHGVKGHRLIGWMHRKNKGGVITVTRVRADGSFGCSVPCSECRKALLKFCVRVRCHLPDGTLFDGRMDDEDAPASKFTSGQKHSLSSSHFKRGR